MIILRWSFEDFGVENGNPNEYANDDSLGPIAEDEVPPRSSPFRERGKQYGFAGGLQRRHSASNTDPSVKVLSALSDAREPGKAASKKVYYPASRNARNRPFTELDTER